MSKHRTTQKNFSQHRVQTKLVIVGVVSGIAIGSLGSLAFVTWSDSDRSDINSNESIAANQEPNASQDTKVQNELSPELQKLIEAVSPIEIVTEIDRLSNDQIAELAQHVANLELVSELTSTQAVLMGELSRRDPKYALEEVWKLPSPQWKELITVVFSEWSLNNLEEAFVASMELQATLCAAAVRSLLKTRTQISSERWLELADEHDYQESMLALIREREAILLLDTPLAAFQQVIQDDVDNKLQGDLIQMIARTMVQKNGYESFDSLFEYSIWEFRDLLMEEAEANPLEFFAVFESLPPESRSWVIYPLVDAWVPLDPETAYAAISSVEEFKDRFYYHRIFKVWAEVDLEDFFARVELFPRSERQWAAYSALLELAKKSPEEAVSKTFDYESVVGVDVFDLQISMIREWAGSDPKAAMNWVTENTSEDTWDQAWLLYNGLVEFAKTDPEAALELALSQGPESVYVERGFAQRVIDDVVEDGELDLAMSALDRVPESTRLYSFTSVGRALARNNRWQEAIELIAGFSDDDQLRYFDDLTFFTMRDNLIEVLEILPELPTEKARRMVAQGMLANHEQFGGILTEDQINYLQGFVDLNE